MALADSHPRIVVRGTWPNPTTLRRGWFRAEARRWNDDYSDATVRLVRGGAGFLRSCSDTLLRIGADSVYSPPLPETGRGVWLDAGYHPDVSLALMRVTLDTRAPTPDHLVTEGTLDDLDVMLAIDRNAFSPFWRFDRHGLSEAIEATGRAEISLIRGSTGSPVAFAITGYGHALSYLQRLAVEPQWQGHGMGRSLVRHAMRRARTAGARAMLLNTQFENEAAIRLYESEGFELTRDPLALLRYPSR